MQVLRYLLISLILFLMFGCYILHHNQPEAINPAISWHNTSRVQSNTTFLNSSSVQSSGIESCGSNFTIFTTQLFNPDSVVSVLPLADFIPPDHVFPTPHAYVYTTNPLTNTSKDGAYIYAPANMVLTDIAVRNLKNTFGVYRNYTDYTLVFQPCREVYLYFHNVASLLYPPFINASLQLQKECGDQVYCDNAVNIRISAGQPIGTIGNASEGIQGVDIGMRDYRLATGRNFVDPDRLCPSYGHGPNIFDRCYTVCPYDYFTGQIQKIRFSSLDPNVTGTSCGTVYQDVADTAKGYWFPADNSTSQISPEATDLFLGQDNLLESLDIFSVGVSVPGLPASRYAFKPNNSGTINKDFSNVTPGSVFCYEANVLSGSGYSASGPTTVIYLELLDGNTLLISAENATSCGRGPWIIGPDTAKFVR